MRGFFQLSGWVTRDRVCVSSMENQSSAQTLVEEECSSPSHQLVFEEPTIDSPEPWAHAKKGPRRSRRQSVLAEELEAIECSLACKNDFEQKPKTKAAKHWSLLAREMKQARLKHGEAQTRDVPADSGTAEENKNSSEQGMPSQASQELAKSNKLEDQINLQHLVELMRIFHEADENGSDGLDVDEFRAAFGQILGAGKNDQQMAIMFMKIDTNCDGTVDWDEFCTYMLLEYQEKEVMAGEKLPPFPYPLRILDSHNYETVAKITYLPALHRHAHQNTSESTTKLSGDGAEVSSHLNASGVSTPLCLLPKLHA